MTVETLIRVLQTLPKDAQVVFPNTDMYDEGIYYVTQLQTFCGATDEEPQVLLESDYKEIAKGW